jgi:hypothetical protein
MKRINTEINKTINEHRLELTSKLRANAGRSSREYKLRSNNRVDRNSGGIFAIGVSFEKHGVFVEKGVGRGRGINSGKANPMPWFNPIMESYIPIMADELAINAADLLHKAMIN